jgi:hypothetical protein
VAIWVKKPGRGPNGMYYFFHRPNDDDDTVTRCGAPTEKMTESIELDSPKSGKCCGLCIKKSYIAYRKERGQ